MRDLKIGFIGCGRHASANIYPSVKLLGMEIACVCARHQDRAEACAKLWHARRAYDSYQDMLEKEQLDAVFVITSGDQHPAIVKDCLLAGTNVFVEKPFGWDESEARAVADVSREVGRHVMVGFMKRFAPAYVKAKRIIDDAQSFGEVLSMTGMFGVRSFGPQDEPFLKYGAIHFVDLIRFFLGEVRSVAGFKRTPDEGVDQVFSFATESGRIGNMFFAGLSAWARHHEEITITGVNGFVKAENMTRVSCHLHRESGFEGPRWQTLDEEDVVWTSIDTSSSGGLQDLYLRGYVGEVRHFLECVSSDQQPTCCAEDNVKTMALCDRIVLALDDPTA